MTDDRRTGRHRPFKQLSRLLDKKTLAGAATDPPVQKKSMAALNFVDKILYLIIISGFNIAQVKDFLSAGGMGRVFATCRHGTIGIKLERSGHRNSHFRRERHDQ
ncbi:MAG: hypothetical protein WAM61_09920 [Desulfobacterales bacterium]